MRPNSQEAEYARKIAAEMACKETHADNIKDLKASAKGAGLNVRTISEAAAEIRMDSDKRAKKYDDEDQLDLLRDALGLTGNAMREAAE
jgi:uncharacterized protein (UPF0335 family)